MGRTILFAAVSLDGFVADEHDQVGPLFDWYDNGDVAGTFSDEERVFHTTRATADFLYELAPRMATMVCGRRLFDLTDGWGGRPPNGEHVFVVTHRPATDWRWAGTAPFTFVDSVRSAIEQARAFDPGRDVSVSAGDVGGQALARGPHRRRRAQPDARRPRHGPAVLRARALRHGFRRRRQRRHRNQEETVSFTLDTVVDDVQIDAPFDVLDAVITGAVHTPDAPEYAAHVTPWNLAVQLTPAAVVDARSAEDVAAAVRFAGAFGLTAGVQGTGHGAIPGIAGNLLISTRGLDEVTVHPEGWARVGAGVTWLRVVEAAAPYGLAPLSGSVTDVGVVGYTTGGGVGPMAPHLRHRRGQGARSTSSPATAWCAA